MTYRHIQQYIYQQQFPEFVNLVTYAPDGYGYGY